MNLLASPRNRSRWPVLGIPINPPGPSEIQNRISPLPFGIPKSKTPPSPMKKTFLENTNKHVFYIPCFIIFNMPNIFYHSSLLFKGPDYFRTTTTLETCAREQFTAENAARAKSRQKNNTRSLRKLYFNQPKPSFFCTGLYIFLHFF